MIVRALDTNHDWTFGRGRNNYLFGKNAVIQNINTRLNSFLGDCFFSTSSGIDWFNLLGSKSQVAVDLAVKATILNTQFVIEILESSATLDSINRTLALSYKVRIAVSTTENDVVAQTVSFLLDEDRNILTTEDGIGLAAEGL